MRITPNTAVHTMALARAERADLADLLATLTPEQWNAPSLCAEWRVRDVVAHMFSYEDLGPVALVRRFAAAGLDGDRVNALGVADYADHGTDELLARVRSHLQPRGLTARFGGRIALTDGLIHHQDIRRALGLPREVPADRLHAALRIAPVAPPIHARRRIRGAHPDRHRPAVEHRTGAHRRRTGRSPAVGAGRTPRRPPRTVRPRLAEPCGPDPRGKQEGGIRGPALLTVRAHERLGFR